MRTLLFLVWILLMAREEGAKVFFFPHPSSLDKAVFSSGMRYLHNFRVWAWWLWQAEKRPVKLETPRPTETVCYTQSGQKPLTVMLPHLLKRQ